MRKKWFLRYIMNIYQTIKQERQFSQILQQFRAVDLNNDGRLDAREIKIYLEYLLNKKLTYLEVEDLFELYDIDKNQFLDFSEFAKMLTRYSSCSGLEINFGKMKNMKLLNAFLEFDQDGDGVISFDEIKLVLEKQGLAKNFAERYAREMFLAADVNNDGYVDFGEFKKIVGDI